MLIYNQNSKAYCYYTRPPEILNYIFMGGGAKGYVYTGSIANLEQNHRFKPGQTAVGSSAGASGQCASTESVLRSTTTISTRLPLKLN